MSHHMIEARRDGMGTAMLAAIVSLAAAGCSQQRGEPAREPSTATAQQDCKQFPVDPDADAASAPERPVKVPASLQSFVNASGTTLTISTFGAVPTCVDISTATVGNMEAFANRRLVGIRLTGYEWDGYRIVDRARPGSEIETGDRPAFSPDGKRFATVQASEAAWGGLEGMGAWEVTKTEVKPLFFLSAGLIGRDDAKFEKWVGNDCFVVSWRDGDADADSGGERIAYRVELKSGVAVRPDSGKCADEAF